MHMHWCTGFKSAPASFLLQERLKVEEEEEEEIQRQVLEPGPSSACISVSTGVHSKHSRDGGQNHSPETTACPLKVTERRAFLPRWPAHLNR